MTPWAAARQASPSMGFPRQAYWSGLPFPSPVDLPDPGIEPASAALVGGFFTTEQPGKPGALERHKMSLVGNITVVLTWPPSSAISVTGAGLGSAFKERSALGQRLE